MKMDIIKEMPIDQMVIHLAGNESIVLLIEGNNYVASDEDDGIIPTSYNATVMVNPDATINRKLFSKFKKMAAVANKLTDVCAVRLLLYNFLEINNTLRAVFTVSSKDSEPFSLEEN